MPEQDQQPQSNAAPNFSLSNERGAEIEAWKNDVTTPPSEGEISNAIRDKIAQKDSSTELSRRVEWIVGHFTPEEIARIASKLQRNEEAARAVNAAKHVMDAYGPEWGFGIGKVTGKNQAGIVQASVDYQGSLRAGPYQTNKPLKVPGIVNRKPK